MEEDVNFVANIQERKIDDAHLFYINSCVQNSIRNQLNCGGII